MLLNTIIRCASEIHTLRGLQGRVAIVLDGAPERFNREAAAWYGWRNTKYANLAKRGAVGVIEVPLPDAMSERNWERAINMSWVSDMRLWIDDQPQEPFASLRLRCRFRTEAAAQLFPPNNGHSLQQPINNCLAGEASGFALPGSLNMSATTGLRRVDCDNVLGVIHGSSLNWVLRKQHRRPSFSIRIVRVTWPRSNRST